jgi:hypothetical protein
MHFVLALLERGTTEAIESLATLQFDILAFLIDVLARWSFSFFALSSVKSGPSV